MISDSVRVIGPRGGRWTEFGVDNAGGLLGFCGFWCGEWLVVACWLALVWTGSVFGSRSRVWSVVWVLRADRRAVFDCCVIGWPLEFRGFGVVSGWWLFVGRCRCGPDRFSVLVLWFGPWFGCFGRMA